MRINDIMENKGIMVSGEYKFTPAKEDSPRKGMIRKEMKIYSPSDWGDGSYAVVGVEINTWEKTIEVHFLMGSMPLAKNLFWALLADRDIRRLIANYQEGKRKDLYKIWSTTGVSGREDIFMTFGHEHGGFATKKTIKLCHISGFGRLNEGFGNRQSKMYIGDFVELVAFMELVDDMRVKALRKKAGVKYIKPKFAEELEDFGTTVTKIL